MLTESVPLADIQNALGLPDQTTVESLLLDCLSREIVVGSISQLEKTFTVEYSRARDVRPSERDGLLEAIQDM
jgi:hypothetical protein